MFGTLFLIFAVVALGMAAVGIYAVMTHAMNRRTQEIGVRMALGAGFGDIMRLVLRRGLLQLELGMVLGISAALGVCQLMGRLLFKVSPRDPVTFVSVAAALGVVGLMACWMPARRAAQSRSDACLKVRVSLCSAFCSIAVSSRKELAPDFTDPRISFRENRK